MVPEINQNVTRSVICFNPCIFLTLIVTVLWWPGRLHADYGAQVIVFGWCAHHSQTLFLVLLSHILVAVLMRVSCGTHTLVLRGCPSKPWCSGLHRHGVVPGEILCRCARDHSECQGVRTALGMWQLGKWWGMELTALCTQSPCSIPLS